MRILVARTLAAAVLVGVSAVPLAVMMNLSGERAVKELIGINPDGCIVRNAGDCGDWRAESDTPTLRDGPGAAVGGSRVSLVGGNASFDEGYDVAESVATFESFDTATRTSETLSSLPRARNHVAVASVGQAITRSAAQPTACASAMPWWNPGATTSQPVGGSGSPRCRRRREAAATAVVGRRIYVLGGVARGASLDTVEFYDVDAGRWTRDPPMPTPRDHLATVGPRRAGVRVGWPP